MVARRSIVRASRASAAAILAAAPLVPVAGCGPQDTGTEATTSTGAPSGPGGSGGAGAGGMGGGGEATGGAETGGGGSSPSIETEVITQRHRFVPGKMFGGWGPHLGHLVRAKAGDATALFWVDDVCSQAGQPGVVCDVNVDTAVGVFRRDGAVWVDLGETALPGTVQQNTGSMATAGVLRSYGVDVAGHLVRECTYDVESAVRGCSALPFSLGPSANYIGAAVSPQGHRVVWWTDVMDGGGGMFEYVVDYGGGWNGPRKGGIGGYNDSSYIHIAFRADTTAFTMHGQLVSGLAPAWSFLGAVGEGDLATTDAVSWQNALAAPPGDAIESTDDVFIDPATSDTHLFARAKSGAAVYYHRPAGGPWSGPLWSLPGAFRLRFSAPASALAIVYGQPGKGLFYRLAPGAGAPAGAPVDWQSREEHPVPLPAGYGDVYAIYPEASVYQTEPVPDGIHVAIVGAEREYEVLHVAIQP
jgi:hypothetical protein